MPAVRFSSNVDSFDLPVTSPRTGADRLRTDSNSTVTPEQIKALTECLHGSALQEQRCKNYSFQPVSLPASRVRDVRCEPTVPPDSPPASSSAFAFLVAVGSQLELPRKQTVSQIVRDRSSCPERSCPYETCGSRRTTILESYLDGSFEHPESIENISTLTLFNIQVHSNETSPSATPQMSHSPIMAPRSPHLDPAARSGPTPPLTPANTVEQSHDKGLQPTTSDGSFPSQEITPQDSGQEPSRIGLMHRPASSDNLSRKSTAVDESNRSHRKSMFNAGAGGQSLPVSRD